MLFGVLSRCDSSGEVTDGDTGFGRKAQPFWRVMKGVGLNSKNEGKKKGGLKVHMLVDAHSDLPEFVRISEAKATDKNFIKLPFVAQTQYECLAGATTNYLQFARFTQN
ncbi:hypothetical protein FQR65_LT20926 [Abscondita terminalis]|nr:hypothetical protein FQR65_LT20926 [Abscondita terminalis]